ncbi:hypothetical protein, partial [Klebsiella pneumoniae]|uniref:hypothetical protein n=1 Tax=Klebsiella pneumoniae TaxID=573 RepID=UPI003716AE37
ASATSGVNARGRPRLRTGAVSAAASARSAASSPTGGLDGGPFLFCTISQEILDRIYFMRDGT